MSDGAIPVTSTTQINASTPRVIKASQAQVLPEGVEFAVNNPSLSMASEDWLRESGMAVEALDAIAELPIGGETGSLADGPLAAARLKSLGVSRSFRVIDFSDLEQVLEWGLRGDTNVYRLHGSVLVTHDIVEREKIHHLQTGKCDLSNSLAEWIANPRNSTSAFPTFECKAASPDFGCLSFLSMEAAIESFANHSIAALEQNDEAGVMVVFDVVSAAAIQHPSDTVGYSRIDAGHANMAEQEGIDCFISADSQQCVVRHEAQLVPRYVVRLVF